MISTEKKTICEKEVSNKKGRWERVIKKIRERECETKSMEKKTLSVKSKQEKEGWESVTKKITERVK